jgi:hypothetical protein
MAGKINVVFASLLKPVDEPRMYYKLARSLAKTTKYSINIIGFRSKNLPDDPEVNFIPLFTFSRISLQRLLAPLRLWRKLLQLRPQLLVINTPELLPVSVAYKIFFGAQLIYDVQENHYRNIIWSHATPSFGRRLQATLTRGLERITNRMIVHYILAERCYINECSFIKDEQQYTLLENKAIRPDGSPGWHLPAEGENLRILFAGTINHSYGILDTLPLLEAISALHPALEYTICGHCPNPALEQELQELARQRPWMRLLISPDPLPHPFILEQLRRTHFSLLAYRVNPSNEGCIPTRLWEALAWQVPLILRQEHPWNALVSQYQAGFSVDFLQPDPDLLQQGLFDRRYYTLPMPDALYWESDEVRWLALVDRLMAQPLPVSPH